ncbi:S41 family peptidase [Algoriphagus halophytocola]|uniref:S41 family peptidase n=1 Tax=Algoriphagus halophytocola TaxID=2991499 RepID=A0ABY6MBY5_9BACT|nr:S41 family peptidase [Algoriphagus sp. TR-M5]UZD21162.1 S41 family peptidase [Algoriphagus sp. TR-M5]
MTIQKLKILGLMCFFFISCLALGQIPDKLTKEEKIYGLSKFWQEVNYNFVYLYKVDQAKWDELYREYIYNVQETSNDYEYYRLLQKFCATLKDGHTNVYFPKYIQENILNNHYGEYRFILNNIDGKAIITHINESRKDEIPIGTEIIEVNGIPTRKYLDEFVLPYISASTAYTQEDWAISKLLEGYIGTTYDLKLSQPNGVEKALNITIAKSEEKDMFPAIEKRELLEFKWYPNNTAYISLNSFSDWEIAEMFREKNKELQQAESLIIDLRNNGGGNTIIGKVILHYLTEDTVFYGSKSQTRQHIATFKARGNDTYFYDLPYFPDTLGSGDRNLLKKKRIVVPTTILIGHGTASAAEDFLIYADKQKHMTKIGEPSYGSTGQPLSFNLPQGGLARVCTKKDTYPDGREFVGVGIQPDILVRKGLADFIENKDPILEKALEFLGEHK